MYKIFINDKPFIITVTPLIGERYKDLTTIQFSDDASIMDHVRKTEELQSKGMIIITDDPVTHFIALKKQFTSIDAGGGIVFNNKNEVLLIKRSGKWDLPKGKIERGEKIEEGALREVEEECGVNELRIRSFLNNTYHTYKLQGHRFLKVTHWYLMDTIFSGKLIPQTEESITEVKWFDWATLNVSILDSYESIKDLLFVVKEKGFIKT